MKKSYIIALDFDGTIVENDFPELGEVKEDVVEKAKEFQKAGASIVLWTCREGKFLQEAISVCVKNDIKLDAINENSPAQYEWAEREFKKSGERFALRKIYADIYVDDKANGSIEYFLSLDVKKALKK
jgi:hydroxymethylpyrimidine pyrophosphatase-like HAD family hydrolase